MKKIIFIFLIVLFLFMSQAMFGRNEFLKGDKFLTPQIGLNSDAIPFGASFEYAIKDCIGIGASVMFQFWSSNWTGGYGYSSTLITPSVEGYYHFTKLNVEKLDVYGGASLGFSIYSFKWKSDWTGDGETSTGSSGIYLSPFVGARYFFSPTMAVNLKVYFSIIGDWSGVGGFIGLTIKLKK